jgi:hypothetical protein
VQILKSFPELEAAGIRLPRLREQLIYFLKARQLGLMSLRIHGSACPSGVEENVFHIPSLNGVDKRIRIAQSSEERTMNEGELKNSPSHLLLPVTVWKKPRFDWVFGSITGDFFLRRFGRGWRAIECRQNFVWGMRSLCRNSRRKLLRVFFGVLIRRGSP